MEAGDLGVTTALRKLPEPHPVLGCRCVEGAVYTMPGGIVKWLPPVHDCQYIKERNERLGLTR